MLRGTTAIRISLVENMICQIRIHDLKMTSNLEADHMYSESFYETSAAPLINVSMIFLPLCGATISLP
jgi:hypothetical protein